MERGPKIRTGFIGTVDNTPLIEVRRASEGDRAQNSSSR